MLVGAMSGPLGGDHFTVEAEVADGARLRVGSAAATIALPGQAKGRPGTTYGSPSPTGVNCTGCRSS